MAVTTVSYLLATTLWWEGPALIIAFGVFLGQLLVGFTNDLNDYPDDLKHKRMAKPLVSGEITTTKLRTAIKIVAPFTVLINILGPLGVKGGLVYMLGILCGVAYNFYFKFSVLSPLPYAIAFAALPSSIAISKDITPPVWMWLGGALFGMAAHFINVIKDMKEDQISKIGGLPQRLGSKNSIWVAVILIAIGMAVLKIT